MYHSRYKGEYWLIAEWAARPIVLGVFFVFSLIAHAEKFTIAVLPDTQNYTTSTSNIAIFKSQTQFIVDNRESMNIVFVSHVGDVVADQSRYSSEWTRAVSAMAILRDAGIPMGMSPGNHDYDTWTDYVAHDSTYWNNYFGAATSFFSGKSWYGGCYYNSLDSSGMTSWQTFTAGGMDFLHISFEYGPCDDVLNWAGNVIAAHPNHLVIITTHNYLFPSGSRPTSDTWRVGYPYNTPQQIWDKFIKVHPQIFMVLSGHVSHARRRVDADDARQSVVQLLSDYQYVQSNDANTLGHGGGWFRLMEFDTGLGLIHVRTYSSLFDKYSTDPSFTDGSTYAKLFAPFNYDSNGNLYDTSNTLSSDFYVSFPAKTPSLVLHYDFEGDSGSTVLDKSGNGINGTLYNNAALVQRGHDTRCLEVNPSPAVSNSGYLRALLPSGFVFDGEETFIFRTKRYPSVYVSGNGLRTVSGPVAWRSSFNSLWVENNQVLPAEPYGALQVYEDYLGGATTVKTQVVLPSDDQWHFVALRMSRTKGLYIRVDDQVYANPSDYRSNENDEPTVQFTWGNRDSMDAPYSGLLDDIMVYKGPMTDEAITEIYESYQCGGWGYLPGDVNTDCAVDLGDFAMMAQNWLECTLPADVTCVDAR